MTTVREWVKYFVCVCVTNFVTQDFEIISFTSLLLLQLRKSFFSVKRKVVSTALGQVMRKGLPYSSLGTSETKVFFIRNCGLHSNHEFNMLI